MRLVKLHELLPTTQDLNPNEHEVTVNFDLVSYFHPTLDGKHTTIMFDADNRLMVSESFAEIEELTTWANV